ncbi:MAG: tRNA (adenosine(37)-N6)-threonylcarbamoyltransferase complex transferase subunit TsaD [Clostridia bacterium]|nr:tRNA (adenosine(37)-N6)-threonylcarbamoyltransferase complex transferase subunit TsaD [Clostridia bacterium]
MKLLAIETSCDETAAAVMDQAGQVLSNVISTQIAVHAKFGGVVPEIASRKHIEALPAVVSEALLQAGTAMEQIDAFAVTFGPGLAGALLCGVNYAKGLAYAMDKPLIAVHHMEGHMMANHVTNPDLEMPYICLVCSGGHSTLLRVDENFEYRLLGQTRDDAAGEAFDKAARALGLPYPGGPQIEQLARQGNPKAYSFTRPRCDNPYDFSFSGLKTAVHNITHNAAQRGETIEKADLAASFQAHVIDFLLTPALRACREEDIKTLSLAGGVCANGALRAEAQRRCAEMGVRVFLPERGLCTDNAVMIAEAARRRFLAGYRSNLTLNAVPTISVTGLQSKVYN